MLRANNAPREARSPPRAAHRRMRTPSIGSATATLALNPRRCAQPAPPRWSGFRPSFPGGNGWSALSRYLRSHKTTSKQIAPLGARGRSELAAGQNCKLTEDPCNGRGDLARVDALAFLAQVDSQLLSGSTSRAITQMNAKCFTRSDLQGMAKSLIELHAFQGSNTFSPRMLTKSLVLRVTTVKPCESAVAAIIESRRALGSGTCMGAHNSASRSPKARIRPANALWTAVAHRRSACPWGGERRSRRTMPSSCSRMVMAERKN